MEEQAIRDKRTIQDLYDNILPELAKHIHQNLAPVIPLFEDFVLERLYEPGLERPVVFNS